MKRMEKVSTILPDDNGFRVFEKLSEEEKNGMFQILDALTIGQVSEIAKTIHQRMNVDERTKNGAPPGG